MNDWTAAGRWCATEPSNATTQQGCPFQICDEGMSTRPTPFVTAFVACGSQAMKASI